MTAFNRKVWNKSNIRKQQARLKEAIDAAASGDPQKRLRHILVRINELSSSLDDEDMLECYIYAMSALVQARNHGLMSDRQQKRVMKTAERIVDYLQFNPKESKIGFLFGDLALVCSQLERIGGDHWGAAWNYELSLSYSGRTAGQSEASQLLGVAIRANRLGDSKYALTHFRKAEELGLSKINLLLSRASRLRTLRLMGSESEFLDLHQKSLNLPGKTPEFIKELEWEMICYQRQKNQDFSIMIDAVSSGGSHRIGAYFLEAFFWLHVSPEKRHREKIAKIRYAKKLKDLDLNNQGLFTKAAETLEKCYDDERPLKNRQQALGKILSQRANVLVIERELLLLAAASVWLTSKKQYRLARMTLHEYENMCRRISLGNTNDCLRIMESLLRRPWYRAA